MIQGILIALIVVLGVRDALPGLPLVKGLSDSTIALSVLGPFALLALMVQALIWRCGRGLDQTGRVRLIGISDSVLSTSRIAVLVIHLVGVIGLGWLDLVRKWLGGDLVMVDELLALLPAILTLVSGWCSYYAIDRRIRDAVLMGLLESGDPVTSLPTRGQYVAEQIRHNMLLVLVPVGLLGGWTEGLERARPWVEHRLRLGEEVSSFAFGGLHLCGLIVLLALMPLALRHVWRTTPLGPGALRDRLQALCDRQGVRCREFLVWHTHTGMINGALVGMVPWFRYILLTETLLERLPIDQVEAVMAHEVAHARRRHLPWLLAVLTTTLGLSWAAAAWGLNTAGAVMNWRASDSMNAVIGAVPLLGSVATALFVFSWVSRKFERQADAFGAQHLSGMARKGADRTSTVDPLAADAMIGALGAVARINRIPLRRFSWRHGSIRARQERLKEIVGLPVFPLPIDRQVAWIKRIVALGLIAMTALAVAPQVM